MDCGLLIAAGGGGDAIAAAILHRALDDGAQPPAIATYAWDRLMIDPIPGPRDPSSFDGLEPVGALNYRIHADTRPRPPAGSTLPRLAAELDARLFLLDPRRGAEGIREQLVELASAVGVAVVTIVDVGADILAHGDEPTLRSPLADSLVLSAGAQLTEPVQLLIAGAGIDGELPEDLVHQRYAELDARCVHRLSPADVAPFQPLFEWHPSEATGMLCAAAAGYRGVAEMRDRGLPVTLSDHTREVHALPFARVMSANRLAQRLVDSRSLDEAEEALRSAGRESEIDYERRKAESRGDSPPVPATRELARRVAEIGDDAATRGIDFITVRGLAERLGIPGAGLDTLRACLRSGAAGQYVAPLWHVPARS